VFNSVETYLNTHTQGQDIKLLETKTCGFYSNPVLNGFLGAVHSAHFSGLEMSKGQRLQ